jgi:hypothetical protein
MKVVILAAHDNGEIVQLKLGLSPELLSEQQRVISRCAGQVAVDDLHITLATTVGGGFQDLPMPPAWVELLDVSECIAREDKTSVFVRAGDASQAELQQYVVSLERALGVTGLQNPERVFHVSLSNLTGSPRGSIAKIWNHTSVTV